MENKIRVSDNQMCDSLSGTSLTLQNAVLRSRLFHLKML